MITEERTPEELKALRRSNAAAFAQLFHASYDQVVIGAGGLTKGNPRLTAAILREVDGSLDHFDIRLEDLLENNGFEDPVVVDDESDAAELLPDPFPDDPQTPRLCRLVRLLHRHRLEPDDAIVLFEALARCYKGCAPERAMKLVDIAIARPAWRLRAIQACPAIFRLAHAADQPWHNALHALAWRSRKEILDENEDDVANVLATVQALHAVGLTDTVDPKGRSALFIACTGGYHCSIAEGFLRHYGIEQLNETRDAEGNTPLHELACDEPRVVLAQHLLHLGADPLARNHQGQTPLECAAAAGRFCAAHVLLQTGAYGRADVQSAADRATTLKTQVLLLSHLMHRLR